MNWESLLCPERRRPTKRLSEERRPEIVRDYGRAVFSTPVRRLQDKAQVFPLEPIDAVRTRLTHSLEVSSVARDLAHAVAKRLLDEGKITSAEQAYEIESIAATAGLVHDIGNPPFGHAGEQAIQDWFKEHPKVLEPIAGVMEGRLKEDLLNFEGNAQTLRLLAKLQVLSDRYGLNLTYATLSAACKYTANSLEVGTPESWHEHSKLGFFASEDELVADVRAKTGTKGARNPITFLVEASDDIVYAVVDIEDGVKKGVISWGESVDKTSRPDAHRRGVASGHLRSILNEHEAEITARLLEDTAGKAEKEIDDCDLRLTGRTRDEAIVQYFRTLVIGKAAPAVVETFLEKYDAIMAGDYHGELLKDSGSVAGLYSVLKEEVGRRHVYPAKGNLRLELLGRKVIYDLMDLFYTADPNAKTRKFPGKAFHVLSQNYRTVFDSTVGIEEKLPREYRRLLLITDYLCGMTDSFATSLHRELFNG